MENRFRGVIYFNAIALTLLVIIGYYNYLLFHMVIELSTVFLGVFIYLIAIYSNKYSHDNSFVFIGIAYLFIGTLDILHTIAFEGIEVFDFSIGVVTRFWLGARFMEAFVLFFAFHNLLKVKIIESMKIYISFTVVTILILISIYACSLFPKIYIYDYGFTTYKKILDVLVIIMFFIAMYVVNKNETRKLNKKIIILSISLKIVSEFLFLVSSTNGGMLGITSHIFKYLSYVGLFTVFVRESLTRPYENIFRAFKEKEKELLEISRKDSLTGLYNHSSSYEVMSEIIKQNKGKRVNLCLMMIDVDDFKRINDKYGHVKGDEILEKIADIFRDFDKNLMLAGRYGGDEFVLFFTDCSDKHAKVMVEKIFNKMDQLSGNIGFEVTLSIGVSIWEKELTAKDLVKTADLKMYEAKSVGKNTYSI